MLTADKGWHLGQEVIEFHRQYIIEPYRNVGTVSSTFYLSPILIALHTHMIIYIYYMVRDYIKNEHNIYDATTFMYGNIVSCK